MLTPSNDNDLVTDSCGCVFCDLGLDRRMVAGRMAHDLGKRGEVDCTRAAIRTDLVLVPADA